LYLVRSALSIPLRGRRGGIPSSGRQGSANAATVSSIRMPTRAPPNQRDYPVSLAALGSHPFTKRKGELKNLTSYFIFLVMTTIPSRRVSSPFMIGLFVIVGLTALVVITLWLGAAKFFQEYQEFNTYFDSSVQGLEAGQPVKYQGVPVGNIQRLRLAEDGKLIEVSVRINKNVVIADSMRLRIEMASIAGSKYLLLFYPDDPFLFKAHPFLSFTPAHPVIPSAPSSIEELRVSLNEAINNVLAIDTRGISVQSVRALRALSEALENPEVAEILHNVNLSSKAVGRFMSAADTAKLVGKAGTVMNDAELTSKNLVLMSESLVRTAEQLERITNRVDKEIDRTDFAQQTLNVVRRYDSLMLGVQGSVQTLTHRADNSVGNLSILLHEIQATNRDLRKTLRMVSDNPSQMIFAEPPPREK
jgi:phospholipid/cholesterol/gamma-HCH transport system substrate-binding protein